MHLAVADDNAGLRQKGSQLRGHRLDGQHPVVQEKHLPSAIQLALDHIADQPFVVGGQNRFDRQTVVRRSLNSAHVPRARQRQVKRARDGRRAEREHVHHRAQHLEPLLVHHAKPLLLVNNDQAKVFERDVVLQQPMRANHDVHRAARQVLDHLLLCPPRAETRKQLDADRVIGHSLAEGVVMLLRKDGCGHEHCRLFASQHGLECRANGHFRLPEADVAADQPVHWLGPLHVALGFLDGAHLIGSFLVNESALEFALPRCVRPEGIAVLRFARGLNGKQLTRDIEHGAMCLFFDLGPACTSERVQRRTSLARANVFADQVRLSHRHVKLWRRFVHQARRVFDDQTFLRT